MNPGWGALMPIACGFLRGNTTRKLHATKPESKVQSGQGRSSYFELYPPNYSHFAFDKRLSALSYVANLAGPVGAPFRFHLFKK
jgi:hypothetical protein